jgi:hypothetical protein
MVATGISLTGTILRIGLALVLVLATFNPSGTSILHWLSETPVSITPGKVLAGLALLIAWFMCLRTTFISLGKLGVLMAMALFAALVWFLVDRSLLTMTGPAIVWVVLVIVGIVIGLGLSWSLIRAQATGQVETE